MRDKAGYSSGGMSYTLMGNAIGNLGNHTLCYMGRCLCCYHDHICWNWNYKQCVCNLW